MNATATIEHHVVSDSEWQQASRELLSKEKEFSRLGDDLSRQRRDLPCRRVAKSYIFESAQGKVGLTDLFSGRSQLATYHFMFGPDWTEGCHGCSYVTDHLNGTLEHLRARDVSLVLISRGPLAKLMAFKQRMRWRLPWVSSGGCDFNRDFGVSFSREEIASGEKLYNHGTRAPYAEENPGLSCFVRDSSGVVFHTYSTYARGLDALLSTYVILDRVVKGRDEAGLPSSMAWLRHHDKYEPVLQSIESCCHSTE